MTDPKSSKTRSLALCAVAYVAALVAAAAIVYLAPPQWPTWVRLLAADIGATLVIFVVGRIVDNSSGVVITLMGIAEPAAGWDRVPEGYERQQMPFGGN